MRELNIEVGKCNDPIIQNILNILGLYVSIYDGYNNSSSVIISLEGTSGY